ncbi:MAG: hypothetical protein R3D46_01730 [Defluviimonas denitrificans]
MSAGAWPHPCAGPAACALGAAGQAPPRLGLRQGLRPSGPAPATLTATAPGRYDLILNDTAAGTPARPGIQPDDLTTTDLFPTG